MEEVTLVITSCNRLHLLKKTIDSFEKYNTYPISEKIIVEDSGISEVFEQLKKMYGKEYKILFNSPPLKQIKSIDRAYKEVKTEYIFHCEDDWEFYRRGFIEDSLAILKKYEKIKQVQLRSIEHDMKVHHKTLKFEEINEKIGCLVFYKILLKEPNNTADWSTVSFNPGLIRKKDYDLIGSYQKIGDDESDISFWYKQRGFYSVILENDAVKHIGWEESTMGHYENTSFYHKIANLIKAFLNLFGTNFKYF